jgi:predicted nucleotidyltransferase
MSRLYEPLNNVFSTQSKVRLLRAFASVSVPISGREAARRADVGATPAKRALAELVGFGVVSRTVLGTQNLYELNRAHRLVAEIVQPAFARERVWTGFVFESLATRVQEAVERVVGAYVFGSAARGDDTSESDFDVLVVTDGEQRRSAEAVAGLQPELWKELGLRLAPMVLSLSELRRQGAGPLIDAVRREGRRLFGPDLESLLHG